MEVNEARMQIQREAVEAAEEADFKSILILPTGTGKGWCLVECLKRINPEGRVWYLCDSTENRDQTFKNELVKWGAEEWIDRIEFMCYQTAYKLEGEDVEVCLADEFDYALTPEYVKGITGNNFKHLVAVSATLEAEKRDMAEEIAPIVYEKTLKEIDELGILNSARHFIVNFMLNKVENRKYLEFNNRFVRLLGLPKPDRKQLEMLQIERKHFLAALESAHNTCRRLLVKVYSDKSAKILIFCGLSEQADKICKYSYHSKSTENFLPLFDSGEIRVLSVVGKIDRGVNIQGVNNVIFESPSRSKTKFTQKSGRARRLPIEQCVDIYYLIPYYKDKYDTVRPTVVKGWVDEATSKINFNPQIFQFDDDNN